MCLLCAVIGQTHLMHQAIDKGRTALDGSAAGYKRVVAWWLLVAAMYLGFSLALFAFAYCTRWVHFTISAVAPFDIFPPTLWSPEANATCWPSSTADSVNGGGGGGGVKHGYVWNTWTDPDYNYTALYYSCTSVL